MQKERELFELQNRLMSSPKHGSDTMDLIRRKEAAQAQVAELERELEARQKKKLEDPFAELRDEDLLERLRRSGQGERGRS